MNYPEHLIPIHIYKKIEVDLDGFFICRTFPENDRQIDESILNEINSEFFDYSTNLFGHFHLEDNYITLIGENKPYFRNYWDFYEKVDTPIYKVDFDIDIDNSKGVFFLDISRIHRKISIPFNIKGPKPNDNAVAFVIHTPTRSNYWHFSIRWYKSSGELIRSSDAVWKSLLITSMRALLFEHIIFELPDFSSIPEEYFINQ